MRVGRLSVVVLATLALVIALDPEALVLDLVAYAWAGFGPVLILSLYWRRMTLRGAFGGVVTGGIAVVVWKQLSRGIFDLYELVPGLVLSLLAAWIMSLTDAAPDAGQRQRFADAMNRIGGRVRPADRPEWRG